MCRRATLALTTCLGACLGVNRAQLKSLLGAWVCTLSFRRECPSFLDVSFVGAQSLPSRKPCKPSGALLDELVLVSVLAPPFSANLRAPPLSELFAFDASDARAGGFRAPVCEDQWRSLYDLSEERREHVRLEWSSQPLDPVFSDYAGRISLEGPVSPVGAHFLVCFQGSQAHQFTLN